MSYKDYRSLYSTKRWARVRRIVFQRDQYRCTSCGKAGALEAHHEPHLINRPAVSLDSFFDTDQIKTLCKKCHLDEHAKPGDPERQAWQEFMRDVD